MPRPAHNSAAVWPESRPRIHPADVQSRQSTVVDDDYLEALLLLGERTVDRVGYGCRGIICRYYDGNPRRGTPV